MEKDVTNDRYFTKGHFWHSHWVKGDSRIFKKLGYILTLWESNYMIIFLLLLKTDWGNLQWSTLKGPAGPQMGVWESLAWKNQGFKFLPLLISLVPLPTSPFSPFIQIHRDTFQSPEEKRAMYQNWISDGPERRFLLSQVANPYFWKEKEEGVGWGNVASFPSPHRPSLLYS